ncbi:MAG: trigger factor [Ruminococcaceae bacterium]|nr:trigger factor [Oscillospiraceae bacterium]
MIVKKNEKTGVNSAVLEITVEKDVFEAAIEAAYRKNIKKMNVPGFRRGKAPRKVVEKMWGVEVFYEEAVNSTYGAAYDEAVAQTDYEIVAEPKIEITEINADGYTFTAELTLKPNAEVKNYKGIAVEKTPVVVTDEDVDNEIQRVRERNSRSVDVTDRPAQLGDTVVIDYEGFTDGVAFAGGKGEGHNLKLGSGQFIPGFEDQLVGKNIGDDVDVVVTFPTEYHSEELAGKEATFKVKVHAIKFDELPEADDEFAKDVSEFDTLAEYKESIRKNLTETRENASNAQVDEKLMDALCENTEVEIPEAMILREMENGMRDFDYRLRSQGLDINRYMQYLGQDLDTFRENFRPQSERRVKIRLALEKIVELEGIAPSEEDIAKEYETLASTYQMELDKVKAVISADDLKKDVAVELAVKLIKDTAVITEKAEEAKEEPKPKKPRAKRTTKKAAEEATETTESAE